MPGPITYLGRPPGRQDAARQRLRPVADPPELLPTPGERPVFGLHRLPWQERACAAWPVGDTLERRAEQRFRRWIAKAEPLPGWCCPWEPGLAGPTPGPTSRDASEDGRPRRPRRMTGGRR
ncbi:MAG: hypothetical protein KF809_14850 [Chloroflexi bacterium]|nr:hypothetical protein [Chloroflexota bacterium]